MAPLALPPKVRRTLLALAAVVVGFLAINGALDLDCLLTGQFCKW